MTISNKDIDKERIKQLLHEYAGITDEIAELNKQLGDLANLKSAHPDTVKAAIITDMPHSNTNITSDPVFQLVARYQKEETEYTKKINELLDKKKFVENMLLKLEPFERRIIDYRYIKNPPYRCDIWKWIGKQVNYSRVQVIRIHNFALEKMLKWYNT